MRYVSLRRGCRVLGRFERTSDLDPFKFRPRSIVTSKDELMHGTRMFSFVVSQCEGLSGKRVLPAGAGKAEGRDLEVLELILWHFDFP